MSSRRPTDRRTTIGEQGIRGQSSRETFVATVHPADLRDGDGSAVPRRLNGTRVRTILVERAMGLGRGNSPRKMQGHEANGAGANLLQPVDFTPK
jgi:hypothetical protein